MDVRVQLWVVGDAGMLWKPPNNGEYTHQYCAQRQGLVGHDHSCLTINSLGLKSLHPKEVVCTPDGANIEVRV